VSTDHEGVRVLLGAYVLGGLDARDRRLLEDHLPTCAQCRDELASSAALPGLLRRRPGVGPSGDDAAGAAPSASPQLLPALLARARAERAAARRRSAVRWAAAAAAAVVAAVLVTGSLVGLGGRTAPGPGSSGGPGSRAPAERTVVLTAESGGGPRGSAQLSPRAWGTALAVDLSALPDAGPFTLEVTGADGTRQSAATWGTTPTGEARVAGATSLAPEDIETIAVVGADGAVLSAAVTPEAA